MAYASTCRLCFRAFPITELQLLFVQDDPEAILNKCSIICPFIRHIEGFPEKICLKCKEFVIYFHVFQQRWFESEILLRKKIQGDQNLSSSKQLPQQPEFNDLIEVLEEGGEEEEMPLTFFDDIGHEVEIDNTNDYENIITSDSMMDVNNLIQDESGQFSENEELPESTNNESDIKTININNEILPMVNIPAENHETVIQEAVKYEIDLSNFNLREFSIPVEKLDINEFLNHPDDLLRYNQEEQASVVKPKSTKRGPTKKADNMDEKITPRKYVRKPKIDKSTPKRNVQAKITPRRNILTKRSLKKPDEVLEKEDELQINQTITPTKPARKPAGRPKKVETKETVSPNKISEQTDDDQPLSLILKTPKQQEQEQPTKPLGSQTDLKNNGSKSLFNEFPILPSPDETMNQKRQRTKSIGQVFASLKKPSIKSVNPRKGNKLDTADDKCLAEKIANEKNTNLRVRSKSVFVRNSIEDEDVDKTEECTNDLDELAIQKRKQVGRRAVDGLPKRPKSVMSSPKSKEYSTEKAEITTENKSKLRVRSKSVFVSITNEYEDEDLDMATTNLTIPGVESMSQERKQSIGQVFGSNKKRPKMESTSKTPDEWMSPRKKTKLDDQIVLKDNQNLTSNKKIAKLHNRSPSGAVVWNDEEEEDDGEDEDNPDYNANNNNILSNGMQKCDYDDVCRKEFYDKRSLVEHINFDHKQWYYECPECLKQFKRRKTIKNHFRTHHPRKSIEPIINRGPNEL